MAGTEMKANRTLLHQLWTKAVDGPNYDKEQWMALEEHLYQFEAAVSAYKAMARIQTDLRKTEEQK